MAVIQRQASGSAVTSTSQAAISIDSKKSDLILVFAYNERPRFGGAINDITDSQGNYYEEQFSESLTDGPFVLYTTTGSVSNSPALQITASGAGPDSATALAVVSYTGTQSVSQTYGIDSAQGLSSYTTTTTFRNDFIISAGIRIDSSVGTPGAGQEIILEVDNLNINIVVTEEPLPGAGSNNQTFTARDAQGTVVLNAVDKKVIYVS